MRPSKKRFGYHSPESCRHASNQLAHHPRSYKYIYPLLPVQLEFLPLCCVLSENFTLERIYVVLLFYYAIENREL